MDQKKIGGFLKELRNEKGPTQEQFAENLNISSRTVSRWEPGVSLRKIDHLYTLSIIFQTTMEDIIVDDEELCLGLYA